MRRLYGLIVGLMLLLTEGAVWAQTGAPAQINGIVKDKNEGVLTPRHEDEAIRRAVALLQPSIVPPIEVIDVGSLPQSYRRLVEGTCAFVRSGSPHIHINSSCPVYHGARADLFEAMKLAAILRHEIAHLDGEDEAGAYRAEARTFRELLGGAPGHDLTRGMAYAVELERRAALISIRRAASVVASEKR
jgi:hypothetical protein